jgi:hypothetical protein
MIKCFASNNLFINVDQIFNNNHFLIIYNLNKLFLKIAVLLLIFFNYL